MRKHATFGNENSTVPLRSSVHGFTRSASLAPARAARASADVLSNVATRSAVLAGGGACATCSPPGAVSRSSWRMISVPQDGRLARCPANTLIDKDFGCGFQSNLSSGTRSSVLRTPANLLIELGQQTFANRHRVIPPSVPAIRPRVAPSSVPTIHPHRCGDFTSSITLYHSQVNPSGSSAQTLFCRA